jgi:nicotinamidase/pyrazinamidase
MIQARVENPGMTTPGTILDFVMVVDTQRDFMLAQGALHVPGAEARIQPMRTWLAARDPRRTLGVLFTFDTHEPASYAHSAEAQEFPLHCVRGTPGWENLFTPDLIHPDIPVWRMEKGRFNLWTEPELMLDDARRPGTLALPRDPFFDQLFAHATQHVTVIGVAADYCVRWAIEGLMARGFTITVPAALTCGINQQIAQVAAQHFPEGRLRIML